MILKRSCFELSGDEKYDLFWAKMSMERWYLLITEKLLFLTFWRWEIWHSFEQKKVMQRWYLLITGKSLFWTFGRWEMRSFLSQKVDDKMIFTDYWRVLVLNFLEIRNTVFLSQKVDGKMIFTWSFWAFHDIPGLGKYGFSK